MSTLAITDKLFFTRTRASIAAGSTGWSATPSARRDDGELFLEYRQSESLAFDDGRI